MDRTTIISKIHIKMDEFTPQGVSLPFDDYIGPIMDEAAKEIIELSPLHLLTPSTIVTTSLTRKILSNIATIKTDNPHNLVVGNKVTISGISTHLEYNSTFPVITVPDITHFTFALTHANEVETADTGGTIIPQMFFENDLAYIPVPANYIRLYELKFPLWVKPVREVVKIDSDAGKMQDNIYLKSGIGRPTVIIKDTQPTGGSFGKYLVCGKVATSSIPIALFVKTLKPEELPEQLMDSLTWLCTSKMFAITGYPDKQKLTYELFGTTISLLIKN